MVEKMEHIGESPNRTGRISKKEDNSSFWNLYSFFYDGLNYSIPYQNLLQLLIDKLDIKPHQRILDIGCGTGNLEKLMSLQGYLSIRLDAIDFSERMLEKARYKCKKWSNIHFRQVDLNERLPYPDSIFDRAVGNNIIYAIENQEFILSELHRVLKPDGKIIISDPKPDAEIVELIKDHFKEGRKMTVRSRLWFYLKSFIAFMLIGIPPIILSISKIDTKAKDGKYSFSTEKELLGLFSNFEDVGILSVWADQNWLIEAYKE